MTAVPYLDLSAPLEASSEQPPARPRCAACDHDQADHDAISLRFCQATQAQALPRNCICPKTA